MGHTRPRFELMSPEADTPAQARMDLAETAPKQYAAMNRLDTESGRDGLEESLSNLVKTRASQINRCAYCIDMHTKDAIAAGESTLRLFELDAWRETHFYSPRERAALALTEAMTRLAGEDVTDAVWQEAATHFGPQELGALVMEITTINAWNRICVSTRMVPGLYEPE